MKFNRVTFKSVMGKKAVTVSAMALAAMLSGCATITEYEFPGSRGAGDTIIAFEYAFAKDTASPKFRLCNRRPIGTLKSSVEYFFLTPDKKEIEGGEIAPGACKTVTYPSDAPEAKKSAKNGTPSVLWYPENTRSKPVTRFWCLRACGAEKAQLRPVRREG